jgi:hypothetical protein
MKLGEARWRATRQLDFAFIVACLAQRIPPGGRMRSGSGLAANITLPDGRHELLWAVVKLRPRELCQVALQKACEGRLTCPLGPLHGF